MPKKCKRGMIWVEYSSSVSVWLGFKRPPISNIDKDILRRSTIGRTLGVLPRKKKAILIDTTRREWWCPKCKIWDQYHLWDGAGGRRCGKCKFNAKGLSALLTKSRCVVVKTVPL